MLASGTSITALLVLGSALCRAEPFYGRVASAPCPTGSPLFLQHRPTYPSAFGAEGFVRMSFATNRATIEAGLAKLKDWLATGK